MGTPAETLMICSNELESVEPTGIVVPCMAWGIETRRVDRQCNTAHPTPEMNPTATR